MFLHHIAHDFDATRHFLFSQAHPIVWWGNIVAGVFVFVVINICWQWFLKKWVKAGLAKIHHEELERHHREVVKPLLESQQDKGELMSKKMNDLHAKIDSLTRNTAAANVALHDKMDAQHLAHMDALKRPVNVTTSIPKTKSTTKKVVKKAAPAKKAVKKVAAKQLAKRVKQ